MSPKPRGLEMTLPAQAENVAVVRHALAGLAEEIGMDEVGLADLKTVVTEACMNVVVHAYDGEPGPLIVEVQPDSEGLDVVVRDEGRGVRPQADIDRPSLRLGLSLIAALSSSFAISGGLGRGTEVSMRLPLQGGSANGNDVSEGPRVAVESTEIIVEGSDLLGPVLARVVGALAARRDLSIERLSDALLVTDAIATVAPSGFADGRVRLALEDRDDGVDLRLGPLVDGSAERIRERLDVPEVGGSLEALTDRLTVDRAAEGNYLVVGFNSVPAG
jgi:serine/threonine-protein kinase RsbW